MCRLHRNQMLWQHAVVPPDNIVVPCWNQSDPFTINMLFVSSDSIEDYIQTTSSNVESANQELAKANQYQVE